MPKNGYTLVELLVVITIMGILSVGSVVYYKSLTSDKMLLKAGDSVQSLLRSAQSNATSGFICGTTKGATTWKIKFKDKSGADLICVDAGIDRTMRTLTLENNIQTETIKCSGNSEGIQFDEANPITVSYSPLLGTVRFDGYDICLESAAALIITLKNASSNISLTVSNGGAINVQ